MTPLLINLQVLLAAAWNVLISLLAMLLPWVPLFAWVAFWLLAVDWIKLRQVMIRGGWVGVVLIGLVTALVWGVVSPPPGGTHYLFGLHVSNFPGKTVYVTALMTILLLCGSVQLSGACGSLARFSDDSLTTDGHGDEEQGHEPATHSAPLH